MADCTHLDSIAITDLPESVEGCPECLAMDAEWCHLRICLTCGHVGCCDSSPNKHATAHFKESGHPIIRSIQPDETWAWCFIDNAGVRARGVSGRPSIPRSPLCP